MKRREALKKTSLILKSAILAPGVFSVLQACRQEAPAVKRLLVLTVEQDKLVKAIADTIIPATDTPSASDVGVNRFIDLLLSDVFEEGVKQTFLDGLMEFDKTCQSFTGKSFVSLSEGKRLDYLEKVDSEVMGKEYGEGVPFYYTFKELTLKAYFSTEEGITQNLNYVPVPGPYLADIAWKEGDKITVGNHI